MINFDGQGVISYRFKMKKMKILKDVIALKFKTSESDGVILHGEGQQGDYITLELRRGRLLLQINLGKSDIETYNRYLLCFMMMHLCVHWVDFVINVLQ